jgi:hypothetical protein
MHRRLFVLEKDKSALKARSLGTGEKRLARPACEVPAGL